MNLNSVAALIDEGVTTLSARFPDVDKSYTFKVRTRLAEVLTPGDPVIVETRNGLKVLIVEEIHDEPEIDPNDGIEYRWAFQAVDVCTLDTLRESQRERVKELQRERRRHIRQEAISLAKCGIGIDAAENVQRQNADRATALGAHSYATKNYVRP